MSAAKHPTQVALMLAGTFNPSARATEQQLADSVLEDAEIARLISSDTMWGKKWRHSQPNDETNAQRRQLVRATARADTLRMAQIEDERLKRVKAEKDLNEVRDKSRRQKKGAGEGGGIRRREAADEKAKAVVERASKEGWPRAVLDADALGRIRKKLKVPIWSNGARDYVESEVAVSLSSLRTYLAAHLESEGIAGTIRDVAETLNWRPGKAVGPYRGPVARKLSETGLLVAPEVVASVLNRAQPSLPKP